MSTDETERNRTESLDDILTVKVKAGFVLVDTLKLMYSVKKVCQLFSVCAAMHFSENEINVRPILLLLFYFLSSVKHKKEIF